MSGQWDEAMIVAAAVGAVVRLANGTTAALVWWPSPNGHRHRGRKARVCPRPGVYLNVPVDQVVEVLRDP